MNSPIANGNFARLIAWTTLAVALGSPGTLCAAEPAADRRRQIESMSPAEKEQLRRQQQRLAEMPPEEQSRLRQLDARLSTDPRADELRRVMLAYYEWLKAQHPAVREELRGLPADARVARVKELREAERKRAARWLPPEDIEVVSKWLHDLVVAKFTPEERAEFQDATRENRFKMLMDKGMAIAKEGAGQHFGPDNPPRYTAEEMDDLRAKLSAKSQELLDEQEKPIDKRKLVWSWTNQTMGGHNPFRGHRPWLAVDQQTLLKFYQEQLTDEQRKEIDLLPTDQKLFQLQKKYYQKKFPDGPPKRRPGDGQGRSPVRPRGNRPPDNSLPPA